MFETDLWVSVVEQVLTIPETKEASEKLLEFTSAGVELISLLGGPFEFGSLQTEVVTYCHNSLMHFQITYYEKLLPLSTKLLIIVMLLNCRWKIV